MPAMTVGEELQAFTLFQQAWNDQVKKKKMTLLAAIKDSTPEENDTTDLRMVFVHANRPNDQSSPPGNHRLAQGGVSAGTI